MNQVLFDYYRLALQPLSCTQTIAGTGSGGMHYFHSSGNGMCDERSRAAVASPVLGCKQFDESTAIIDDVAATQLGCSFAEVIENLRRERYRRKPCSGDDLFAKSGSMIKLYYVVRECLPVFIRRKLQRAYFRDWEKLSFPRWPVDFTVDNIHEQLLRVAIETSATKEIPFIWFWPAGADSCLIVTHDVETAAGRDFTSTLMDLDDSYGFKASFQVIPQDRYEVPDDYVGEIRARGFEFNIHDLNHDGQLYWERPKFLLRAAAINRYARRYGARGFRAGSMHRNQEWYDAYEFSYDMSVPNVAHLEPTRGGCCTVMPYFIGDILELPVTTVQDFALFNILREYSIDLWKRQLALVSEKFGLMSIITHPDYLIEGRARRVYESLLDHLRAKIEHENVWVALPGEVDMWWRARSRMNLVQREGGWEITGPGKERARLAYASLDDNQVTYKLAEPLYQEK